MSLINQHSEAENAKASGNPTKPRQETTHVAPAPVDGEASLEWLRTTYHQQ